jgi:hypothetical protein
VEPDQGRRPPGSLLQQRLFPFAQREEQVLFAIGQPVEGHNVGRDCESVVEPKRHGDLAPDSYLPSRCFMGPHSGGIGEAGDVLFKGCGHLSS